MTEEKVLIINTGGTISMVPSDKNNPESALRPSKSWNEVVKNYQLLATKLLFTIYVSGKSECRICTNKGCYRFFRHES